MLESETMKEAMQKARTMTGETDEPNNEQAMKNESAVVFDPHRRFFVFAFDARARRNGLAAPALTQTESQQTRCDHGLTRFVCVMSVYR